MDCHTTFESWSTPQISHDTARWHTCFNLSSFYRAHSKYQHTDHASRVLQDLFPLHFPKSNQLRILYAFFLGNSPASEFYVQTFRNNLAHIQNISTQITPAGCSKICLPLPFPKSNQLRILYAFFWVIPRRLNFMCKRFGTPWRTFKISAHRSRQQGAPRSVYHFLFQKVITSEYCMLSFLGNSPASEFYMPTFRNTLSVPSS